MKKLLLASFFLCSATTFAAETASQPNVDNHLFAKAEQLYRANNYTAAYQEIDRLAKTGNAQALYNLALLNEKGQGTPQNPSRALTLYKESSDKGYFAASYRLAEIYTSGQLGVTFNQATALEYIEKASKQGSDDATIEIALGLFAQNTPESNKLALEKLTPLVNKNNYRAIHVKAIYEISNGLKTKSDTEVHTGLKNLEALALEGYVPALIAVGNMLINGHIVPQNLVEARKIFAALAEENIPQAKESLAEVDRLINEKKNTSSSPQKN